MMKAASFYGTRLGVRRNREWCKLRLSEDRLRDHSTIPPRDFGPLLNDIFFIPYSSEGKAGFELAWLGENIQITQH